MMNQVPAYFQRISQFLQKHLTIILILVLAFGLRLPLLNGSLWLDEAAQALESARPFSEQLQIAPDFQPPLIHLILFFTEKLGTAEWWMRIPTALLPGLITIWATYELAKREFDYRVATLSALLLATSSFHIFYSQELRPYSLPAMWAILSFLSLLKALRARAGTKTAAKRANKYWALYILCSVLGLYSSYLYPFFWLGQLILVFWDYKEKLKEMIQAGVWMALSFMPWLPFFLEQLRVGGEVRKNLPGWESVVSISQIKSLFLVWGKFLYGVVNLDFNPYFLGTGFLLLILFGQLVYKNRYLFSQKTILRKLTFLLIWLFWPLFLAWIVSFFIPVIRPKRVLFLLPGLYLFLSFFAFLPRKKSLQQLGLSLVGMLLALNLWGTLQYHLNPQLQRENWRGLHAEITRLYDPAETVLLFSYPGPFSPWRWYAKKQYPTLSTGKLYLKNVSPQKLDAVLKEASTYQYILLFDYLRTLTDPDDQLREEIWALGFHEINTLDYPQIGFVRVYSRSQPTAYLENML